MNRSEASIVIKLVLAHLTQRPGRMALTLLSTVAAACVVVWVVSGYDSLVQKFDEFSEDYLGRYEFVVLPVVAPGGGQNGRSQPGLSRDFVAALQADPRVVAADPIFQTRARITKTGAPDEPPAPPVVPLATKTSGESDAAPATPSQEAMVARMRRAQRSPSLVGTAAAQSPYQLVKGKWIDPEHPELLEGVITQNAAEHLKVDIGDQVTISSEDADGDLEITIIGIVVGTKELPAPPPIIGLPASRGPPLTRGPARSALYVPMQLAERATGKSAEFNYVGVVLKPDVRLNDFRGAWRDRLAQAQPAAEMQSLADVDAELDNSSSAETVRAQAYSATGISLLAAMFIIFTTLSMGVDERIRQFAMLRAVALNKTQVAAMIAFESLVLGLIGWAGGLLAGWGLLKIVTSLRPEMFPLGASLGIWCIVLSGVCAVGGSLAASIMPAWKATRVRPLDAMVPATHGYSASFPWWPTALGVALVCLNPLLVFYVPMPDASRYTMSAAIGCTAMAIGFVLLAPAAILLTEKLFGPVLAVLLRLHPQLLATQLSSNLWRTVGATVALTLGLGLFVATQTWGYSMLAPYTPGDWSPDLIAGIMPRGVPNDEITTVQHTPGVMPEECLPLAVEQTKFAEDYTGFLTHSSSSRQDNCVMLGVDLAKGLEGSKPMFDFDFVEGDRASAVAKLKQGRYCLVPDHFARESGLKIGDGFSVVPFDRPDEKIEYKIAGVVSMTGWHWLSKIGFRNHTGGRSAGLMFASFEQIRRDFPTDRTVFFWMNLDGTASEAEVQKSLESLAKKHAAPVRGNRRESTVAQPATTAGAPPIAARATGARRRGRGEPTVAIRSREGVRTAIRQRADGIIWTLSRLPLITLAVTSLGVVNTILSSIRARRWDLGVLRSLGVTRFGLFRLIIAEAILVAFVACVLSFAFGTLAGYCGTGVTRYVNVRGGQFVPLVIPWLPLAIGFGATLLLCLLAALWPAAVTGRTEPLRLLQAGRAAR